MSYFQQQVTEILLSSKVHEAFDVSKEDPKLRERYGTEWGDQRQGRVRRRSTVRPR